MSTDRTTEILNYLTAISREVGELRAEIKQIHPQLEQINSRLELIARKQKRPGRRLARIEGLAQTLRADVDDLQDRVAELESKQD
jgi:chromosome segregation ATPase